MPKFNARQEKFIQGYLKGMTATDAYIYAGYKWTDRKAAGSHGSRLVENGRIAEEIKVRRQKRRERFTERLDDIAEVALDMLPIMIKLGTKEEAPRVAAINLALKYAGLEPIKKLQHSGKVDSNLVVNVITAIPEPEESED